MNQNLARWIIGMFTTIMLVFMGGFGTYVVTALSDISTKAEKKIDSETYEREIKYLYDRQDRAFNLLVVKEQDLSSYWMYYYAEQRKGKGRG